MTDNEYTPTTDEVRSHFHATARAEFDRWYDREKAKWQAEALRDASLAVYEEWPGGHTYAGLGVRWAEGWLDDRADRIEREGK